VFAGLAWLRQCYHFLCLEVSYLALPHHPTRAAPKEGFTPWIPPLPVRRSQQTQTQDEIAKMVLRYRRLVEATC
jgi:hypothetical protein